MSLPSVKATVTVYNPEWKEPADQFWVNAERDVEVLTLNLNSGTMRVRFMDTNHQGKTASRTQDIANDAFFDRYNITEKS